MFYYYYEYIANSGCYFKPMKESYSLLTDFNQIRPLLLFLAVPKLCRKLGKGDRERSSSVGESYCLLLGQYCYIFRSMVIDLRFPWYFRCSEKLCFNTHARAPLQIWKLHWLLLADKKKWEENGQKKVVTCKTFF